MSSARKLVLCVIDGLVPEVLEHALDAGRLPALRFLRDRGTYTRGVSTFPSLTPVCLSAIATGGGPDVHGIPHLVWYHRQERRVIEYGSSLGAVLAAGVRETIRNSVIDMSSRHLSPAATTVFEALEDSGLVTGAINFTCYRGRHRHLVRLPEVVRRNRWYESVDGPRRFFFFNLYESDATGAPLAVRSRTAGSVDLYALAVGRWLVTRDGFDFLLYYLPDFDFAAHAAGPHAAMGALERADACLSELMQAAGGYDEFLERYAIVVCSDHAQTAVRKVVALEGALEGFDLLTPRSRRPARCEVCVTASNRAGMLYLLPPARVSARELAVRIENDPAVDVVLFREGTDAIARREGEELRFSPGDAGWKLAGDSQVLDPEVYPLGVVRAWSALTCPNAGEVIVSASEGYEFADLGGRGHAGGGSHGSLLAGDSLVPMLACGIELQALDGRRPSITDLKGSALVHFGLAPSARVTEIAGVG
jgi:predicted AlkP superfamily pyrophosphatase or phosphodiesterase